MKKLIILFILSVFSGKIFAQADTIKIQTSALCEMCKKTLESDLSFEKGVKKSMLDLDSKVITVIYDPKKTTPEKIKLSISQSGYDADSLKADPKAFKRLPDCCRKEMEVH